MDIGIWTILLIICKLCLYTGSFVAMGGCLFLLIFDDEHIQAPKHTKDMIYIAGFVAIFASIMFLLLQTGFIIEEGFGGMFDLEMLQLMLDENIGTSLYLRIIGMILLIGILNYLPLSKWLIVLPIVVIAASFAIVGHATGEYQIFTSVLIVIHLVAVSFWVGALLPLYLAADQPHAAQMLEKFGKVASLIVPLLIVVGILFAITIIGSFSALFTSSYGITFIVKIVVVGLLLGLATLNKFIFVPNIAAQKLGSVKRLRATIITEAAVFVAIFLVTAILTSAVSLPE